jgi:hypothetical protein
MMTFLLNSIERISKMRIDFCPYCGSDMVYVLQSYETRKYQVQCIRCLKFGKQAITRDLAIQLWNDLVR